MAAWYPDAVNVHRPGLQQIYAEYFADTAVDAILFPTSPVLPAPIDEANGSSTAPGGLPVGINLDGPVGSDRRVLAIGMAVQSVLGSPPAPPI